MQDVIVWKRVNNYTLEQPEALGDSKPTPRQLIPQNSHNRPYYTMVTRICAAEMAVRYAALCACRKVHT